MADVLVTIAKGLSKPPETILRYRRRCTITGLVLMVVRDSAVTNYCSHFQYGARMKQRRAIVDEHAEEYK